MRCMMQPFPEGWGKTRLGTQAHSEPKPQQFVARTVPSLGHLLGTGQCLAARGHTLRAGVSVADTRLLTEETGKYS